MTRPIFALLPRLEGRVPWVELAELPTPVAPLPEAGPDVWVKHDGRSSPLYGGNKVRTLEPLCALALAEGATRMYGTGAYGSNHVLAMAVHAPRVGLKTGAVLFPQPRSPSAIENARALMGCCDEIIALRHWSTLPWGMWRARRRARARGEQAYVMVPGGAIPRGTLGYVSAALEVADQVEAGLLPPPRTIVLPAGSTCTTAGLLLGFALAERRRGLRAPVLHAVRVTPWPVTAKFRIAGLAIRAWRALAALAEDEFGLSPDWFRAHLEVDGRQLGRGYGHATEAGLAAKARLGARVKLDTTYSAKAAAAIGGAGPVLFWATKSEALPTATAPGPARMMRWAGAPARRDPT